MILLPLRCDLALIHSRSIMGIVDLRFPPKDEVEYDTEIGATAAGRVIDLIGQRALQ